MHSARQAAVAGTAAVADLVGKGEMIQELRALFRAERAREADAARSAERSYIVHPDANPMTPTRAPRGKSNT